ncbi:hypothetical protein O181_099442 [Austropuccinia psidii MF-1]|uniref:Uncharacterized protein n=1 Tax=Austropuccinia psidii MF-1 TaxID=1389203 RepID=A0A9Q3JDA2_9BASI|nr:hypothetical protein [Austropuccinia psidii MF-1]
MGCGPQSVHHGPRSVGLLGHFWPNSNEAKRGQGGSSAAPKARCVSNHKWAHLSQLLTPKPNQPTLGPKLAINQSIAAGNHQRPPDQLQARIPLQTQLNDSKSSPKSITNFKGGIFRYSVWQFPGSYQKIIQGPQPPDPTGVGLSFLFRTILRAILRGNQSFQPVSRHRGESRVNRRRLTSRQANVKQDKSRAHVKRKSSERRAHVTLWSYTKSCDIQ